MRAKVVEISWHDTQPVYSCDFQPIPPAQLKRILPFPQPHHAHLNSSNSGEASHGPGTPNVGLKYGPSPSPTPGPSSMQAERSTSQSGGTADAGDVKASSVPVSTSAGAMANRQYRLATAGADKNVRIWMVYPNVMTHVAPNAQPITPHPPRIVYLSTLKRHTAAVNVVRWSPNGQILASAGDDGLIILWVPSDLPPSNFGEESAEEMGDKEFWRDKRAINVTKQEIYDIAWSPDGKYIIAGSTDNLAQVFSVADGSCVHQIQDHAHYVQGVAWDPLNEYLATQSSDRTVQVHSVSQRNNTLTIHPTSRDRSGKAVPHSVMEIRNSRAPSFSMVRPSVGRRSSTVSDAGSTMTMGSELPDPVAMPPIPSSLGASVPATPLSTMNPPSNKPSSRRSSFSSTAAAGSPLLAARDSFRGGRSPSPAPLPAIRPAPLTAQSINQKLYGDELATNFFRRLTFSPDGGLLFTPAGQIEETHWPSASAPSEDDSSIPKLKSNATDGSKSTVYIYSRANLARPPIAHLPGHKTTTVAVRFSPIFYDLRPMTDSAPPPPKKIILDKKNPVPVHVSIEMPPPPVPAEKTPTPTASMFALPYRLMYAVAAQDSVLLYDTQQAGPIAIFKGLHYSAFTDVAWSPAGDSLVLTSSDGYCSIIVFDAAELGTLHFTQQHHRQLQAIAQSHSSGHISAALSLPPSPAPGHTIPASAASSSKMDKDGSSSSLGSVLPTAAGSFHLPGPTTPGTDATAISASTSDTKLTGIHGLPVGTAGQAPPTPRASAPGSPVTLLGSTSASSTGSVKRPGDAPGTDASGKPKKRRIELTRVE
ncbi:Chromatin assembly factor 1 subunit [Naganishia albida]|nr:Chromatin assembly factor 1 subunit [Naganishia albida]